MKRIIGTVCLVAGMALFFGTGCASRKVARVSTEETIDLSGRWNDSDSRLVSEEMIKDALERPWLNQFTKTAGKEPRVIVGTVVNKSHEHINVETFVRDLERELTNSGRVFFVASKSERDEVREERLDQAVHSSQETAKEMGQEEGADYMMKGAINTIQDELEGTKVVFYQVDLELIDMANNKKVWLGQKKIKKVVEKSKFGF